MARTAEIPQSPDQRKAEDLKRMELVLQRKPQSLLDRAQYQLWSSRIGYGHPLAPADRRAMQVLKNLSNGLLWSFLVTPWDHDEGIKRRVRL